MSCSRYRRVQQWLWVLGDDLVIETRAWDHYIKFISQLGGVVNPAKSFSSDTAAEFAGLVIDRHSCHLKRVKARDLSDNSFMVTMSVLGEQASSLLRPRQRKVWNELKFVPGVAVEGNYSRQSYGEPLSLRYQWYLRHVASNRTDKDDGLYDHPQAFLRMMMSLKQGCHDLASEEQAKWFVPRGVVAASKPQREDAPKPDQALLAADKNVKVKDRIVASLPIKEANLGPVPKSGDPRLENGKTALQSGEDILEKDTFISYPSFKSDLLGLTTQEGGAEKSVSPAPPPTPQVEKPRKRGRGR